MLAASNNIVYLSAALIFITDYWVGNEVRADKIFPSIFALMLYQWIGGTMLGFAMRMKAYFSVLNKRMASILLCKELTVED